MHKSHSPPDLPPGRPIISVCGSITEKISLFVNHHSKHLVQKCLLTYRLQDLLRHIEELNKTPIPDGAFPVSIDVTGLYSNIPHKEGLDCLKEALGTQDDLTIPTAFLVLLMSLVLTWNMFDFDTIHICMHMHLNLVIFEKKYHFL